MIELSYETGVRKYKKLQVLNVNDTAFFVRITNYSETSGDTLVIPKDKTRNFTYYSFKNTGSIIENIEPDKNGWDLVFTRYNHFFYDILPGNEPFPYRVSGVLSNSNKVMVARDSSNNFDKITGASIPNYLFSADWNAIGYDWKSHAFGAAFDNPDLIVAAVVGDGEAETGPLATSWHSNKFLNPVTDGAVLPILHLNGYKIASPTILARIPKDELQKLFEGYGYDLPP